MRTEVRDMLADGMVDRHFVDRMLLACFLRRRVQTARDLLREIVKQAPTAVPREEWALLADRYEQFSPWLAVFLRRAALPPQDGRTVERLPADAVDARDARVTLRIVRRRTGRDSRDHNEDEADEEEVFRTVAPLSATVDELKQKLWQEQVRLAAAESGHDDHQDDQPLRPSDMGVLYRTWKGAEVPLQGPDALQDYLLPSPTSEPNADASAKDDHQKRIREKEDGRKARHGKVDPTPSYDIIITHEPRLLAFAHFADLAEALAKLKAMIDGEERGQWSTDLVLAGDREGRCGSVLYDYLCHHFEYLEEQNALLIRHERKERQRRKERAMLRDERQKKDAENGMYREQPGGRKEKRMETGGGEAGPGHHYGPREDTTFSRLASRGTSSASPLPPPTNSRRCRSPTAGARGSAEDEWNAARSIWAASRRTTRSRSTPSSPGTRPGPSTHTSAGCSAPGATSSRSSRSTASAPAPPPHRHRLHRPRRPCPPPLLLLFLFVRFIAGFEPAQRRRSAAVASSLLCERGGPLPGPGRPDLHQRRAHPQGQGQPQKVRPVRLPFQGRAGLRHRPVQARRPPLGGVPLPADPSERPLAGRPPVPC